VRRFRFYCRLSESPRCCGEARAPLLLAAAQEFARSRGYGPADIAWLGTTFLLGGLRFSVEEVA
jgi:hypothetical protein